MQLDRTTWYTSSTLALQALKAHYFFVKKQVRVTESWWLYIEMQISKLFKRLRYSELCNTEFSPRKCSALWPESPRPLHVWVLLRLECKTIGLHCEDAQWGAAALSNLHFEGRASLYKVSRWSVVCWGVNWALAL